MSYTVKPGDTLQSIAIAELGDASLTQYLASINHIAAQNGGIVGEAYYPIQVGQVLITDVAELSAKRLPIDLIIAAAAAAIAAAIHYRKKIANLF